jgi:2-oxoglutarate dehydrogenase E2 component (dihydrolipoamide succinyltransferase)
MDIRTVVLPKLGESILSATVVKWLKQEGEKVLLDEPLLEVSTDKINSEIPSPYEGTLHRQCVRVGQEVEVGASLAEMALGVTLSREGPAEPPLSPSVQRLIQESNLSSSELATIPHTGHGGRLTKKDIECYLASRTLSQLPALAGEEIVEVSSVRKGIAEAMVRAHLDIPDASLITEIDVTDVVLWMQETRGAFEAMHQAKLTVTALAARALCLALKPYPKLNASWTDKGIQVKKHVGLGVAVAVDDGVMVPVLTKCDELFLPDIAHRIQQLADKARKKTLTRDEVRGGSITLTNFGMKGALIGLPILRAPEGAIVALGAITKQVKVMKSDQIVIRSVMYVTLTFDHRIVDGLYASAFLGLFKKHLEQDLALP